MYYYLMHFKKRIENTDFLVIKVLYLDEEKQQSVILNAYKKYSKDLEDTLDDFNIFYNITEYVGYNVRTDRKKNAGKLVLSLNL